MNIFYVKAEHLMLPKVSQYLPEYMFEHYVNIVVTLITERGQKV